MQLPTLKFSHHPKIITEGRIVYLLSAAFAVGAATSIVQWNQEYSVALVTGFIVFAQETISQYFASGNGDPIKKKIVVMLAIGYCALFGLVQHYWNPVIGGQLIAGFMLFSRKLGREYFTNSKPSTPSQNTGEATPPNPEPLNTEH